MIVTIVSQCEKRALLRTRRVLDSFANRIGSRTWQTVITAEGLQAVKKLLRASASKNTAVSCHWIRSRTRSELVWIVGNRRKFNSEGIVPVNLTGSDTEQFQDKSNWKTINLIRYAASIAALFHDFGKANQLFQNKINPDNESTVFEPYRHEWVSLRLFQAFVGEKKDSEWLDRLADVEPALIEKCFRDGIDEKVNKDNHPILNLPPLASLIAWIIVSHHRLPLVPGWEKDLNHSANLKYVDEWMQTNFCALWNSYRCRDQEQQSRVAQNWAFDEKSLPYNSSYWRAKACTLAVEAKENLALWLHDKSSDYINEQLFTSHIARMVIMLSDHHYSAAPRVTTKWRNPDYKIFANSDRQTKKLKQQLDEHLIGVAYHAERIAKKLPKLKGSLTSLDENEFLGGSVSRKFKENFGWQDTAVKAVEKIAGETTSKGFFGINMASTGKGKTIANAKLMYALGEQTGGTRFSVAMGLRTLTLQTAREFRDSVQLTDEQLAVMVGGIAVRELSENAQASNEFEAATEAMGSVSDQEVLNEELFVHYNGSIDEHSLSEWTSSNDNLKKILCAPVLVSTIDHLMPATEGTRGGKQIGPMLRLLTSDLVLDEPDDFGLEDLPALCRLVHWAGVLGSRVLLSTATMPPVLANALFQAYQAGWSQFAKANIDGWTGEICCAWFDESLPSAVISVDNGEAFKKSHKKFVISRISKLAQHDHAKRVGEIISIVGNDGDSISAVAETLHGQLSQLHQNNHVSNGTQQVSIGLIRMANINPLVAVAQRLIKLPAPDNTCIHYCVYHSRYPLAIRSHIEAKLDNVLMRKDPQSLWEQEEITSCLNKAPDIENHIFVVLASPVAEVGRDHDYDWAVVEPSSIRSIIQLAGRVLRHREPSTTIKAPNILLLNQNYKAIKGGAICFTRPGFESKKHRLSAHDLLEILPEPHYKKIDAAPRIDWPKDCEGRTATQREQGFSRLNDLEHRALQVRLLNEDNSADLWWRHTPHWCGEVQRQQPFRKSEKDEAYYLYVEDDYSPSKWYWLNENVHPAKLGKPTGISISENTTTEFGKNSGFWFEQDPLSIYSHLANEFNLELTEVSRRFGGLRITHHRRNEHTEYFYDDSMGVFQEMEN